MTRNILAFQRARTFLFVPGDRPERFIKAEASGADVVVLDLEDAVASDAREQARAHVAEHLLRRPDADLAVRISAPTTPDGVRDLETLRPIGANIAVIVSKADSVAVAEAHARLPEGTPLLPLVESARGIRDVHEIASASGVARLLLGHLDLCAELGIDPDDEAYLVPLRFAVRAASAAADLAPPVDGVTSDFTNLERLRSDTVAGLRAGFSGKLCIHPAQVPVIHQALLPPIDEVHWARRVIALSSSEGVSTLDGVMVDRPVILRAESVVRRSEESR